MVWHDLVDILFYRCVSKSDLLAILFNVPFKFNYKTSTGGSLSACVVNQIEKFSSNLTLGYGNNQ